MCTHAHTNTQARFQIRALPYLWPLHSSFQEQSLHHTHHSGVHSIWAPEGTHQPLSECGDPPPNLGNPMLQFGLPKGCLSSDQKIKCLFFFSRNEGGGHHFLKKDACLILPACNMVRILGNIHTFLQQDPSKHTQNSVLLIVFFKKRKPKG